VVVEEDQGVDLMEWDVMVHQEDLVEVLLDHQVEVEGQVMQDVILLLKAMPEVPEHMRAQLIVHRVALVVEQVQLELLMVEQAEQVLT
tara:strand:+ start:118 stop:381 length:264 start_codon:yes stop_codon:yes gene_type:complete